MLIAWPSSGRLSSIASGPPRARGMACHWADDVTTTGRRPPTWLLITRLPPRQVIRLVEDPDLPCGQYVALRDVLDLVEQPDDCARRTPSSGGCGAPSTMAASRSIARRGMSTT